MIALEAPLGGGRRGNEIALTEAPMFGRNASMGRWHIPRSGTLLDHNRIVYSVWCSSSALRPLDSKAPAMMVDDIPDELPVCGTCVGRAQGAGHDLPVVEVHHEGGIIFEPRIVRVPRVCPGSKYREWHHVNYRIGRCYVCDWTDSISVPGGYGTTDPHLRNHEPGSGLVDPCPFHAWNQITAEGVCSCGHDSIKAVR